MYFSCARHSAIVHIGLWRTDVLLLRLRLLVQPRGPPWAVDVPGLVVNVRFDDARHLRCIICAGNVT